MNGLHEVLRWLRLRKFRSRRSSFYRHLARSMAAHELLRSYLIDELRIARAKRTAQPSTAIALAEMVKRLERSDDISLARIVGSVMPAEDRMLLAAVDGAKDQPATLRALATALEEQAQAKRVVARALLTPAILVPGIFAFAMILSAKVIPTIAAIAPEAVWTPYLVFVRALSTAIAAAGLPLALATLLLSIAFCMALPRVTGPMRAMLEQISPRVAVLTFPLVPWLLPLSMYRDFVAGQILTSLAVLLDSGSTLNRALQTLQHHGTPYVRWHVRRILAHLDLYSTDYVGSFGKGLLSAELLATLASTIRNNPKFDAVLIELGTRGNQQIREHVQRSAATVNAMLLIASAVLMGVLYSGQFMLAMETQDAMDPARRMQRLQAPPRPGRPPASTRARQEGSISWTNGRGSAASAVLRSWKSRS